MMPSIDDFRSDAERCGKRTIRSVFLAIGGMFAFMLLGLGAKALCGSTVGPVAAGFVPAVCFLLGVPLMLYGFWVADRHYKDFPTLQCHNCGKSLFNLHHVVVASRNCPHCGQRVIMEPNSPGHSAE